MQQAKAPNRQDGHSRRFGQGAIAAHIDRGNKRQQTPARQGANQTTRQKNCTVRQHNRDNPWPNGDVCATDLRTRSPQSFSMKHRLGQRPTPLRGQILNPHG
jgi:hypothetical protein